MVKFSALTALILVAIPTLAGCQEPAAPRVIAPSECFVVKFSDKGEKQFLTALKKYAVDTGLQYDNGNPPLVLLNWQFGGHAAAFSWGVEQGGYLTTYQSGGRAAPDLKPLLHLQNGHISFAQCPPTSVNFSPPTFYE